MVLRVTVCLAGHFLLPVAVRGGVGGGFIASRAGAPAAPCTCRSTGLSSPSPAQLILWAHARRKSCRLRTDWVSVLKTGRVPSGLDSSGGGGKQAACRSHVLTCSGPRVPGAVLRFVPGRRRRAPAGCNSDPPPSPPRPSSPAAPRGQPGKAGRGPLALTGLGRRVVPDGAAWRDDGLLRGAPLKTGQWHATRDAFAPAPSGGPGESRARAAPLSRRPPCPCGWCTWRRERGPVRGSGKDLLPSRAGPLMPAVGGGVRGEARGCPWAPRPGRALHPAFFGAAPV